MRKPAAQLIYAYDNIINDVKLSCDGVTGGRLIMKKRFLSIALVLCMLLSVLTLTPTAVLAADDDVTPDYSWYTADATEYTIYTAEQLLGFANLVNGSDGKSATDFGGKTVKLGADINLSGIAGWTPIGGGNVIPFKGTFDGNDKCISNLTNNGRGARLCRPVWAYRVCNDTKP